MKKLLLIPLLLFTLSAFPQKVVLLKSGANSVTSPASGTAGTMPYYTGAYTIANSGVTWDGSAAWFGGSKIINTGGLQNNISNGKAMQFDGVNDNVSLGTSTQLDLGTGDGTYFVRFKNDGNDGVYNTLFITTDATNETKMYITSTGILRGGIKKGASEINVYATTDIGADGKVHSSAFSIDRDVVTGLKLYLDGKEQSYSSQGDPTGTTGSIASSGTKYVGIGEDGTSFPFAGSIYALKYFNCALTADEIKNLSEGGSIPFKYVGGSNTPLTSGTLVIGKKYLIKTYVASDVFTNVGAASNAAGVSFIATGTTPTTWTNSSNLIKLGEILSLDAPGMSTATWYDQSGNGINGTVSGATLYDAPLVTTVNNLNASSLNVSGLVKFTGTDCFSIGSGVAGIYRIDIAGGTGTAFRFLTNIDQVSGIEVSKILSPITYVTTVGGTNRDLYIDNTGLIGYVSSSNKTKDSIKDLTNVDWLWKLRPVKFIYRSDTGKSKQYGLVAEEVDTIQSAIVSYDLTKSGTTSETTTTTKEPATVNYSRLIVPILKAVQDHQKTIVTLNDLITSVKTISPTVAGITRAMLARTVYISLTAPVTMGVIKQIANGEDGQEVDLIGLSNTNFLTLHNGDNIKLKSTPVSIKLGQVLTLKYCLPLSVWVEKSRSLN